MTFPDVFSEAAGRYAASRPRYPDGMFARFAALAPGRDRAWDCGTGSGQAAIGLARWFDRVEATDASAAQIESALAHERVAYSVRTAEDSGLPDASIDLISVAQALHWFDRPRFFAEARRVLKTGGVLAAYGYSWFYISPEIDASVDEFLLRPVAGHWLPGNRLLWDGYRSIDFPFDEISPPRLAIHGAWSLEQLFDYYLTWSATRAALKSAGIDFLSLARQRLAQAWGDPAMERPVIMPLSIRLGRM
jgi:SAM-dependent methyltransferase